jgi:hypothetical protein
MLRASRNIKDAHNQKKKEKRRNNQRSGRNYQMAHPNCKKNDAFKKVTVVLYLKSFFLEYSEIFTVSISWNYNTNIALHKADDFKAGIAKWDAVQKRKNES